MARPIRVLVVEDSPSDAALVIRQLEQAGYAATHVRVDSAQDMAAALAGSPWDIVLSDYSMPGFDALHALCLLQATQLDIPFIVVSGGIGEDIAVQLMKSGAHDYVMKDKLARLAPAVERELREAGTRREKKAAVDALADNNEELTATNAELEAAYSYLKLTSAEIKDSEERYRSLFENMLHGMSYCHMQYQQGTPQDYTYVTVNSAFEKLTGLTGVAGKKASEVSPGIRDSDPELFEIYGRVAATGVPESFETYIEALGMWFSISVHSPRKDYFVAVLDSITERKLAEGKRVLLHTAIEQSGEAVVITDISGMIQYVNPAFEKITGFSVDEIIGQNTRVLKSGKQDAEFYRQLWQTILAGQVWTGSLTNKRKNNQPYMVEMMITPVLDGALSITSFVAVMRDVTEKIRQELELRQAQKLEAIGQLAAGIAHEINTPMQYVGDNTVFLKGAMGSLLNYVKVFQTILVQHQSGCVAPETWQLAAEVAGNTEIGYLMQEIPLAIDQTLEGIERVTKIVRAMKEFSFPGLQLKSSADINRAIESTVTVARNVWKYVADVELQLDPSLPMLMCFPGDISQVILNLLTNATHAIEEVKTGVRGEKGKITIITKQSGDFVEISIGDTGSGIPEEIRDRIYEPFFTTKTVGKGTGQGLAITYAAVVERHCGRITFDTEEGKGTTFKLLLPIS